MNKREPVSKRKRFEVFKRDNFKCQYCYSCPPNVALEVDHIIPVSKGGKSSIENLITACFDCNRGKSDVELTTVPSSITDGLHEKKTAIEQFKAYKKMLKDSKKEMDDAINMVENVYSTVYSEYCFGEKFRISVKKFIDAIGISEVMNSMESAVNVKRLNSSTCLTYFCGICWNKIRENE